MPFAPEAGQYFHVHLLLLWAKLQYFINNCVRAVQVRHFFSVKKLCCLFFLKRLYQNGQL